MGSVRKKHGDELMKKYEVYVLAKDGEHIGKDALPTEHKILAEVKDRLRNMVPGEALVVNQVR